MFLKVLVCSVISFNLFSLKLADEVNPILKVTYLDGSDASNHYEQSLIEGTQTIKTYINEAGDYLIDGSLGSQIKEQIYIGPNYEGTIEIKDVNIFYSGANSKVGSPIYIDPSAKVNLLISGDNVLSAPQYYPAIGIYGTSKKDGYLIIDSKDNGYLTASTIGLGSAAIGGRGNTSSEIYVSDILIKGGNLTVKTIGTGGSGIGTGERGYIETIDIQGGNLEVYAYGYKGGSGAAIGSGSDGTIDNLNISGGNIVAYTAKSGVLESNAAAIGGGSYGKVSNINISGGKIEAISSVGASIGSGLTYLNQNDIESFTISGGIIKAKNYLEGEPSIIGLSKNSSNALKKFNIDGGSIICDEFSSSLINSSNKTLYPLNIKWDKSPISSIFVDDMNMNIVDLAGGEEELTLYLEGKDANLVINTPNSQITKEIVFDNETNSLKLNEENEEIPSTPLNTVPEIFTVDKEIPQYSYFDNAVALEGITAYDEENGDLTDQIKVIDNPVDTNVVGDYYVTFYVEDYDQASVTKKSKVSVYKVEEAHNPPLIYANDLYFELNEIFNEEKVLENAKAYDENNVDISNRIIIKEQNVNTSKEGTYKIVYQVTDDNNLTSTLEIKAIVENKVVTNNVPVITCNDFSISLNEKLSDLEIKTKANVYAYDEEDKDITNKVIISKNEIDYEHVGNYIVEFQVEDNSNNIVSKQIIVSVIDSQPNNVPNNKDIILGVSIAGGVIVLGGLCSSLFFIIKKTKNKHK